jgi:hypothetical protein
MADTYVFSLSVQDDEGLWSAAEEWTVVINPIDQPPVSDAGPDRTIRIGASQDLNGGSSYDNEGEITEWLWKCTSHPTVPGLVNTDQMVASFTPPDPGTYTFSLEVMDEAGQWSEPDYVEITVLEQNSAPVVNIIAPKTGDRIYLENKVILRITWDATDANMDTLMFKVEVYQIISDENKVFIARKSDLPHGTTNWTFNDTAYNFPRATDMEVRVQAWETSTSDRYETIAVVGPFQVLDPYIKPPDDNGEDDKGLDLNWIILAIVVLLGIGLVAAMALRGSSDEDEVPWEDEAPRESQARPTKGALAMKGTPAATAAAQAEKARKAKEDGKSRDPKGRLLDCPDCGAPLDHDTDFGAPYCWDCDKYF